MLFLNTLPTYEEAIAKAENLQSTSMSSAASNNLVRNEYTNHYTAACSNSTVSGHVTESINVDLNFSAVQANAVSTVPMSESLQQLSTNTLPPYSPRPLPEEFKKPEMCETFCCSACGDTFVLKSSLNFHLQRRSVLIRFNCDSCPSVQAFYNRCSLLSHIRSHADKQEPSDIAKALVLPLPRVLMEGIQTDMVQTLDDEDDDSRPNSPAGSEVPTPTKLLEVFISEGDVDVTPNIENLQGKEKEVIKNVQCSECETQFTSVEERRDHFTNKEKMPTVIAPCQKCGIICPSECSSKAHKRLHLQISPYVCPECGDNPDRYWENFQRHLTYQCFHYARALSYKCNVCNQLFKSSDFLKQHSVSNHTDILYKCQMCPMAFTNFTHFQVHKRKSHAAEGSLTDPLQMYKCSVCDVVFLGKDDSDNHWDSHLKENICQYAFICSECNEVLNSKLSLCDHFKDSHVEIYNKNISFLNLPHEVGSLSGSGKYVSLNKTRMECLLCHAAFMTRQGHSLHVTKSHSNHKYPCGVCNKSATNRMAMISHGKEHLRENMSLCLLCQNKPMKPPESLDHHLLYHVERVKYQSFCPICETALFTFDEALQHLRMEHLLNTASVQKKHQGQSEATSQKCEKAKLPLNENSQNLQPSLSSKLSSATTSNTKQFSNSVKLNPDVTSYARRVKTGENLCAKCDFKSLDRVEFKQHILTHKEKRSSFQCQECGICFVVEPSLKKHLKIVHKIVHVDQYVIDEGTNHLPESETVTETAKNNDLECTVCFEVFASETLLKTHMRSHGMAFIQAKKNLAS